jgi:hypothetical protein
MWNFRPVKEKRMKFPKRWHWIAVSVGLITLATAATRVKGGGSSPDLDRFQADGIATLNISQTGYSGTIKGNQIGIAKLTDDGYAHSSVGFTGNGGDDCFLGGGVITITTADGSSLDMARSGLDCNISGSGLNGGNSGNHVYIITGGTGRFAGASGTGNYVFGMNNGIVLVHIDGNIELTADRDSH